ncbi:acyl-CoA synthetase [Thiofilum flexile]|uniref:acyl-CoA synthetase n=1 Tax=Thiofilum flexile TaxID=125627 RepID=UPI00037B6707|nr:acyl-CoA synthetase [Thiofilum flexile]
MNIYQQHLDSVAANYEALSPLSFLKRTADIYPTKLAVVHGEVRRTWQETYARCCQLASALSQRGIGVGDTVSIICPNLPEHFEAHFGVPMVGAVLNSINTRLDAATVAFILQHAEAKLLITEREMTPIVKQALALMDNPPPVIDIDDPSFEGGELLGEMTYEQFIAQGDPAFSWSSPANEWDAISLNYTSGTTGDPKGVVYHHRGAYLNAVSNILSWGMPNQARYLWTLPMFHCNGWCFPWVLAAIAGVNVCLRHVRADKIVDLIAEEKVDHLCGAPIVLSMIAGVSAEAKARLNHPVKVMTAGAPPPAAVIQSMEEMGFSVTHVYGLTETYGPCVVSEWKDEWNERSVTEKARLKARQGVRAPLQEGLMVANPDTLEPVPQDGQTLGEVFMRGNIVMKGYLKNPKTTEASFEGGWFHSGDLAVWHPDGYIEIKDRSKDIIISGGENISSIELEDTLYRHPAIQDVAVVAKLDEKWGEVPCAFIKLVEGAVLTEAEVIEYCRQHMARFKVPKTVIFVDLPRTSTGKVQKFVLRQWANKA